MRSNWRRLMLPLLGDSFCNNPFDGKRRLGGIASRGERLVARAEEAGFREPSLWLRQDDVGWDQAIVTARVALEV